MSKTMEKLKTIISDYGTELISGYEKAGMKEREYLEKLYGIKRITVTPAKSDIRFDATICQNGKNYVLESKVRYLTYEGWFLEEPKYKALMVFAKEFGMDALYVSFTPSGTYEWNISEMTRKHQLLPFRLEWMNETTAEGKTNKVQKSVTRLPEGNAKFYKVYVRKTKEEEEATRSKINAQMNKALSDKRKEKIMSAFSVARALINK